MRDTVFVPSFGNRPRVLVGRDDVLSAFESALDSAPGSRERSMLLLGQRGYGKTILLLEFAEIAKNRGFIVASPTVVSNELTSRILEKLSVAGDKFLARPKPQVTGGSVSVLGIGAGIEVSDPVRRQKSFGLALSDICSELNKHGKPVLILVDEVQAANENLRQLVVAYQEMIGEGLDVSIVFAGLPAAISSMLNDHVLTFLNRAAKTVLPKLREGDIALYYSKTFSELGVQLTDELISRAAKNTHGSPYLMQLIGHYILVAAGEDGINEELFDAALERAKKDFIQDICQTTVAPLSEKDVEFLAAMAEDDETSNISDIICRLGWASSAVQTYKRRLIQAGIVEQKRRGTVCFAVPYLREYLREMEN